MKLQLPFKKRNIVAVLLGILLLNALVRQIFNLDPPPEEPWSIGTLMLPGDGEVSQTFAMPVSGSFMVALLSIKDDSIKTIPGIPYDRSFCKNTDTRPSLDIRKRVSDSPERDAYNKELSAYFARQTRCKLDGRFGVVEIELKNLSENSVDTHLSSDMFQTIPRPGYGLDIADFRRFDKGTEFEVTVRSYLSESHKERERVPYKVMINPNRIECSGLAVVESGNPENCAK